MHVLVTSMLIRVHFIWDVNWHDANTFAVEQ